MNPVNDQHIPLPLLREMFNNALSDDDIGNKNISQLDLALNAPAANFKLLHHLLIGKYSKITMHHRDTPLELIGLDIETDYETGEPKLLGFSYPDGYYHYDYSPTLESFFAIINGIMDNRPGANLVSWGNLDITGIIRLFNPTEEERKRISRGISGRFQDGEWIAQPPLKREINGSPFYIDHYISGRSLRLCVIHGKRSYSIWIYNLSQFYQSTIAETAKALKLDWKEFDKDTHLIDWQRFDSDKEFMSDVLNSNRQDARTVRQMAQHLIEVFHNVFRSYPKLLVSAGSLADAAVSTLLDLEEYAATSWRYLTYGALKDSPFIPLAENILSEAYSAGYVDQYAVGYFPEAHTADISSAYPDKIRQLPDLRECVMFAGHGDPNERIRRLEDEGLEFFTAVIRGRATIPEHLKFHPITVRTSQRQNIRPIGTFGASYFYEERQFCREWGARFDNEEWVIFALRKFKPAPIAQVSHKLATLREDYRKQMNRAATDDETILFDSMQYMVKVIDNSLYGKHVMSTEIVEDVYGKPVVTGYKAGDRFNLLYAGWITATTRVQLAEACMSIQDAGSQPILTMTDSIYWTGRADALPAHMIAKGKVAGKFEPVDTVKDFYIIKTGQYEYRKGDDWFHKMRGLNVPFESRSSDKSFYRNVIKNWAKDNMREHGEDVEIEIPTRRLVTIGSYDLENLALVQDGVSTMRPFLLSGKQSEGYVEKWRDCLDGHVWLAPVVADAPGDEDTPYEFLSGLHEKGGNYLTRSERKKLFFYLQFKYTGKAVLPKRRLWAMSWADLEEWSGVKREWCKI